MTNEDDYGAFRKIIMHVFDQLGGLEYLRDWAHENPEDFYIAFEEHLPVRANTDTVTTTFEEDLNHVINYLHSVHNQGKRH